MSDWLEEIESESESIAPNPLKVPSVLQNLQPGTAVTTFPVNLKSAREFVRQTGPAKSVLESVGLYGWNKLEPTILSCLLLGETPLLVGLHGEGKTTLAFFLAKLMGVPFVAYDTAKVRFEDVLGFPDPHALMNPEARDKERLKRISTPQTIDGKHAVLLDEFSRASPEMMAKFMELLDWRRTMLGAPTDVVWIWVAMNPIMVTGPDGKQIRYNGIQDLDPAICDRFQAYFEAPITAKDLSEAEALNMYAGKDRAEPPGLRLWHHGKFEMMAADRPTRVASPGNRDLVNRACSPEFLETAKYLQALMYVSGSEFANVKERWEESVGRYVYALTNKLYTDAKVILSTRKQFHIRQALFSAFTLHMVKNSMDLDRLGSETNFETLVGQMLPHLLPLHVSKFVPDVAKLQAAHAFASQNLRDRHNPLFAIELEKDPLKKLGLLLQMTAPSHIKLGIKKLDTIIATEEMEKKRRALSGLAAMILLRGEGLKLPEATLWMDSLEVLQNFCTAKGGETKLRLNNFTRQLQEMLIALAPTSTLDGMAKQLALAELRENADLTPEMITATAKTYADQITEGMKLYRTQLKKP